MRMTCPTHTHELVNSSASLFTFIRNTESTYPHKLKRETAVSQGLITFVLLMYKHLTREQRYGIYLGLQKEMTQKTIAQLIGVSESTVSRKSRRNKTKNGKYVWDKADDMSSFRVHRSPGNRSLSAILRWRIEEYIKNEQWSL